MLILKKALSECGIPQQELARISGHSKALISRILVTGVFPRDMALIQAAIHEMIDTKPALAEWMQINNCTIDDLYEKARSNGRKIEDTISHLRAEPTESAAELQRQLSRSVGRATIQLKSASDCIIRLSDAIRFLQQTLSDLVGNDAPYITWCNEQVTAILSKEDLCGL